MKSTGIVRKVDELGRIVLPVELRKTLDIAEKDPVEIYTEDDSIVLRKYVRGCKKCGEQKNLIDVEGDSYCRPCAKKLAASLKRSGV
jgi:transcriptional pleiotropic regulator of transition state genes